VAIRGDESAFNFPKVSTFYGRYVNWDGSDKRSPLPSLWSARFLNGGAFSGGTDFIVFRDTHEGPSGAACGSSPFWYPLFSQSLTAYDENADSALSFGPNGIFGLATQKVAISSLVPEGLSADFGRMELALGLPNGVQAGAWVIPIMTASGKYSVDFNGQPLNSGCGKSPFP
jgi:hypothetical protein